MKHMCDNWTPGLPDKKSVDAESDLDLETDGSDSDENDSLYFG